MSDNANGHKNEKVTINRRKFIGLSSGLGLAAGATCILGVPPIYAKDEKVAEKVKTNLDMVKDTPRTSMSLPGLFPGKVIEVEHGKVWKGEKVNIDIIPEIIERGMFELTGRKGSEAWKLFVDPEDVVGIKVNPVGEKILSTHPEIVDEIITQLEKAGVKRKNIIIWDRFSSMLTSAGYVKDRYPDIEIAALQYMDEDGKDTWKDQKGEHISKNEFDLDAYYYADVDGPDDPEYINQHVFNGKYSYFGKLITKRLTKIINIPVLKNTGNSVSMATKNMSFAVIANTGRLHQPVGLNLNAEILAFPVVRDKLVLNILDGLKGQYEGGPMLNTKYVYVANKLLFATDPFAQDYIGYLEMLKMRKTDESVKVNDSPRYIEYIKYAEKLGIGVADPDKVEHKKVILG